MADYKWVIFTNAADGREEEFNTWYTSHMDDVLRLPGFMAGQRYEEADPFPQAPSKHKYMAIYDIETDDIAQTMQGMFAAAGTERLRVSDSMDPDVATYLYRVKGPAKHKQGEG